MVPLLILATLACGLGTAPAPTAPAPPPAPAPAPADATLAAQLLALDPAGLAETAADTLGAWQRSRWYSAVAAEGVRVVEVPAARRFFAVWLPPGWETASPKRVLVGVPGTDGTAYEVIHDEIELARVRGYAVVGIQAWDAVAPGEEHYLDAAGIHGLVDLALRYMEARHGATRGAAALVGFSRSAAESFPVAFLDRHLDRNRLALTIAVSGGYNPAVPPWTDFWDRLQAGEWGADAWEGARFWLYCGLRDEQWGPAQCGTMDAARKLVEAHGGQVDRFLQDQVGGHSDFFQKPDIHGEAVDRFLALTGGAAAAPPAAAPRTAPAPSAAPAPRAGPDRPRPVGPRRGRP